MLATIKAKETRYNGYRFRSRLEARWAVFFDTLGIKYEYEKEGYDFSRLVTPGYGWTDGGAPGEEMQAAFDRWHNLFSTSTVSYLPDFWIPHLNCWIEIKGVPPTKSEDALAEMLAWKTGQDVYIFYGDIQIPNDWLYGGTPADTFFGNGGWDSAYYWCECGTCGHLGIEFDGRSDRLSCKESYDGKTPGCPRSGGNRDKGYNGGSARLVAAYTAARSARFEFGEHGR